MLKALGVIFLIIICLHLAGVVVALIGLALFGFFSFAALFLFLFIVGGLIYMVYNHYRRNYHRHY